MDRTQREFSLTDRMIGGDVCIGCGETHAMRRIADVAVALQREYPEIRYHLYSGNASDVSERLDKGLLDFGVLIEPEDMRKYDSLRVPGRETWGVLMRDDCELAKKDAVAPADLIGLPLLVSQRSLVEDRLSGWLGRDFQGLNVAATYNLVFNAGLMVEAGMGYALCIDHLVNTMAHSGLCFRPLQPKLESSLYVMWKKYQVFTPAAELFLRRLQEAFAGAPEEQQ